MSETQTALWFVAASYGACANCGEDIVPDDIVRANGDGGYLCEECGYREEDDGECLLCEVGGIRHTHGSEVVD